MSLFDTWEPIIDAYKNQPMTEIEFRFGRQSGKSFDTNVGPEIFQKVFRSLSKFPGWESVKKSSSTVYYFKDSKRLIIDEATDEQVGQIKKKLVVNDYILANQPVDIRLGISSETPFEYDGEETSTDQKTRERWSFVRKNLSIDLTIVRGTPVDKDSEQDTSYQIELEIIDPTKLVTRDILFNILNKVFDILKVLS